MPIEPPPRPEIKAIAFDVNGTLVEIWTDEHLDQIFRAIGHFLTYQGIDLRRHQVRDRYFAILNQQRAASAQEHPEFDAEAVWRQLIDENASDFTRALPPEKLAQLPLFLAEMYRGISRRTLKLYPHVRHVLNILRERMPLAVVTDAQSAYARAELHKVGILDYFDPIVISGDHGYRKPDARLFRMAVDAIGVPAANVLYVGNDMHRDIHGAREAGMQTVMFDSNQGTKHHHGTVPDQRITDFRDLLAWLGL
ncbi:putative hydrolase of the HAD superfamily [Nakamurella panacisegetis]|uniref:Putative hydrolase of the HAD superfamily n=1 Tax=Nakamurella panacisegetis TaxID=1090615 RepID=A0A1H0KZB7_9ACTN|nr:HAD family hydrolase [Nakamurella panacisegetis]SDO61123.1 putative hydrolase of the HAD superfamily [Nakamurella panacisegetis]